MLQHRLGTARFFCGVWDFGVMASRGCLFVCTGSVFWVLSALTLCSKFVGGTALEARLGWDGLEFLSTTAESTHTNNVADQLPAFDDGLFEWETLTSKNGAPSRVGRKKAVVANPSFTLDVNWPADGVWKLMSGHFAHDTGITVVRVSANDPHSPAPCAYILEFYTSMVYNYNFDLKSGGGFGVYSFQEGLNSEYYDAEDPTIIRVTAL